METGQQHHRESMENIDSKWKLKIATISRHYPDGGKAANAIEDWIKNLVKNDGKKAAYTALSRLYTYVININARTEERYHRTVENDLKTISDAIRSTIIMVDDRIAA